MANQNGQLILQALQDMETPATINGIVTHIADTAGVRPKDVKDSVRDTLDGGVRYGYIQKSYRRYFAAPVDLDGMTTEEATESDGEVDSSGALEDRARRRRRGRRGRSRRRGSRRRRRRRRR